MWQAPADSIPKDLASAAMRAEDCKGLFARVNNWLSEVTARPTLISEFRTRSQLRKVVMTAARKEWRDAVKASTRLRDTYSSSETLKMRGYLKIEFRGQRILTKLRLDDLKLGAAGYKSHAAVQTMCALCGKEPETRIHFTVNCPTLQGVRDRHGQTMRLTRNLGLVETYQTLILARPPGATENGDRAMAVGALLYDLWTERCRILGIRSEM